jgi:recombination protein RecT
MPTTTVVKPHGSAEIPGQESAKALEKRTGHPLARQMEILLPKIEDLLPPDIAYDQFRAAVYLELSGRPALATCVEESLRDSVIYAANYGLLPGRDCHFLPFKQKKYGGQLGSTCVPNYFGIILAMERTGKLRRAFAHPVHEGDEFEFDMFADRPMHKPAITLGKKPGKELFYYGVVMFKDGTCAFEIMTLDELEAVRRRSPAHDNGPWVSDPVMMKRKTVLKRVGKYVKLTPRIQQLIDEEEAREREDIPPERHRQNLVDLFSEGGGGYVHQREPTREESRIGSGPTPGARRDTVAWETLTREQANAALPTDLLERIHTALSTNEPATDSEAFVLADEVLGYLDHQRETQAGGSTP